MTVNALIIKLNSDRLNLFQAAAAQEPHKL